MTKDEDKKDHDEDAPEEAEDEAADDNEELPEEGDPRNEDPKDEDPEDDDDDEDDDDEDDDEDEPEAEAAAPPAGRDKRVQRTLADSPEAKKKIAAALTPPATKKTKKKAGKRASRPSRRAAAAKKGSPTRNIILFVALVGGLAAAFALLGGSSGGDGPVNAPKWKVGQTVDVEITAVTTDVNNLDCAMSGDIAGRYCAFESQNQKSTKPREPRTDDKLLQPYTTVDRIQLMGSGLWMTPQMKEKLDKENWDRPSPRFTVKCKFAVEGRTKTAFVQWKPGEGWHSGNGWYTGHLTDCKIQ